MKTREEQIAGLVDDLKNPVCRPDYSADIPKLWLEKHILEAERRAEQRVWAEIGRDSERLDWLTGAVQEVSRVSNRPTRWILEFRTSLDSLDRGTLRQAIDAAMESK